MPMITTLSPATRRHLRLWLLVCMALVVLMVWVGGMTRLTESGLSMVEWKPLHIFPPLNDAQWQEEFSKYQQYPEYQKVNAGMSLEDFKGIFWLEFLHRLLGRGIGMVFLLPLLYFACVARIPARLSLKYAAIFALGGLQGLIGWVMVKSGLEHDPWVSPVKLALHLGMAFALFGLLQWQYLRLAATPSLPTSFLPAWVKRVTIAVAALVFFQILLGALVAGRDAGLIYNSYPTMNGQWIPDGLHALQPWWHNAVENITAIQFNHRVVAHLVLVAVFGLVILLHRRTPVLRSLPLYLLAGAMLVQFGLGIWTLLAHVAIPLASAHQMVALLVWATLIALLYRIQLVANHSQH